MHTIKVNNKQTKNPLKKGISFVFDFMVENIKEGYNEVRLINDDELVSSVGFNVENNLIDQGEDKPAYPVNTDIVDLNIFKIFNLKLSETYKSEILKK